MKRHKSMTALAALAAIVALSALGTASASAALPEFVGTFPTKTAGAFSVTYFETSNEKFFECKKGESSGEITGATTWTGTMKFQECTFEGPKGQKCQTPGAGAGEIWTEALKGTPDYTSIAKKEVALRFNSVGASGLFTGKLECSVFKWAGIEGGVMTRWERVNHSESGYSLPFRESRGIQQPNIFETELGKHESNLTWERVKMGLEANFSMITSKAIELKA